MSLCLKGSEIFQKISIIAAQSFSFSIKQFFIIRNTSEL